MILHLFMDGESNVLERTEVRKRVNVNLNSGLSLLLVLLGRTGRAVNFLMQMPFQELNIF